MTKSIDDLMFVIEDSASACLRSAKADTKRKHAKRVVAAAKELEAAMANGRADTGTRFISAAKPCDAFYPKSRTETTRCGVCGLDKARHDFVGP